MNKLLKIEIAVLVILLAVAVAVRVGNIGQPEQPTLSDQENTGTAGSSGVPENSLPDQPQPTETTQPTETVPPETEPPVVLTFAEDFTLESGHYFVYDCARENVMAVSGEMTDKIYPASVTKLFTAYVALRYLEPETVVTVGQEVNMVAADSSLAYIKNGQELTVAQLVEGMLLPSGNDAAYAVAAAAARVKSGDSGLSASEAVKYFVNMMNETAQELGMTGTNFRNPDGYHDHEHYTNCADLVTIARLALDNELIRTCTSTYSDRVTYSSGQIATWTNTNALINPDSQYYCADAVGLKTGSTSYAGFCLLSAFELEGDYIIIGSFGCVRPEDRFIDTLKLYNLVLDAFAV